MVTMPVSNSGLPQIAIYAVGVPMRDRGTGPGGDRGKPHLFGAAITPANNRAATMARGNRYRCVSPGFLDERINCKAAILVAGQAYSNPGGELILPLDGFSLV